MVRYHPVLIVGAGPAGLAAARALQQRGLDPLILEKRPGALDKVCGEGIMPVGLACLKRLGLVLEAGYPLAGVEYRSGSLRAAADFAEGPGRGVRRLALSAALRPQTGLETGVQALAARPGGRFSELETNRGSWRCDLLVIADGLHSPLRASLGWHRSHRWPQRWGWRRHYACAPWNERVEVHLGQGAEAYVTPVGPDQVGVAVLSGKGRSRRDWLDDFPELRRRLEGAAPLSELAGYGPLRQSASAVAQPGIALIGDASGYVDACTGEGLSLAFLQAEALAGCCRPETGLQGLDGYARAHRRLTHHYRWLTGALLVLHRWPALRELSVRALRANPHLFQRLLSANQGLGALTPLAGRAALALLAQLGQRSG